MVLTTAEVRDLCGTYSPIAILEPGARDARLTAIARIADEEFGGQVERRMVTALYTARIPPGE